MASPRPALLSALVIVTGALLAYHNSFTVPFVFDDEPSILANPSIRHLGTAWWPPPNSGGITVAGRPLLNFTFGLNYAVSGLQVWSYHWLNLLIHALAGLTLFGLVRRTLHQPALSPRFGPAAVELALLVAAIWTLHPLQTESVTYVVQRAESLASLFYLLTLWCFIRAVEPGAAKKWPALAVGACLLGMLTKEIMVSAPLLVALYDRVFVAGSWREAWARRRGFYLSLAATWLVLLALVLANPGRGGSAGFGGTISPVDYALTQFQAVAHYLRLAFWPSPLILDYGPALASGRDVILPALLLLPLLGMSLWGAWTGRAWGFCGVFFFALLAPSSSFVPVAAQTISEHRVYLALAAVVVMVVTSLHLWLGRKSLLLLIAVAVALGAATVRRNQDYATNIRIYEDIVAKRPGNARAMALLGDYYRRAGRMDDARRMLERSLQVEPGIPQVMNNLGNVWQELGALDQAVTSFERAVARDPKNATYLNNLGIALILSDRVDDGLARLEAALRLAPNSTEARANFAKALARNGRFPEAAVQFEILLKAHPGDATAHDTFSQVLQSLGRNPEALAHLETAVQLQPANADLHNRLGIFLGRAGRLREALAQFEAALAIDPNHESARQNAALARQRLGR